MDELSNVTGSITRLIAAVGGGVSAIMVCYAGVMWMMSGGDPQGMAKAKMGFMGALGGLIVVGLAFIVPMIVSRAVIEPVGGVAVNQDVGFDCDQVLKRQFVFQRGASDADRLNVVIRQVQSTRGSECPSDVWNPLVNDDGHKIGEAPWDKVNGCFSATEIADPGTDATKIKTVKAASVGDTGVPRGLRQQNDLEMPPRVASGRDRDNNIIIYWDHNPERRPASQAACWMYSSRLTLWEEEY